MIGIISGMTAFITVEKFFECVYSVSTNIYYWWYPNPKVKLIKNE